MAGCNTCGAARQSQVQYKQNTGPLPLAQFADCDVFYEGPSMVVVAVDRGGPNERLYNGKDLGDAAVYASQHGAPALEMVNAFQLCAAAIDYYHLTPP